MPRGKKTDPETIYKVMASYAVTNSYSETARTLNIPISTVKKVVGDNKNDPEFAKVCNEKKTEFSENATRLINKALVRIEKMLDDEDTPIPLNHLSTMTGTLFDKRALALGESTDNTKVIIKLGDADEYGG